MHMLKRFIKKMNKSNFLDLGAGTGNFLLNVKKF